MSHLTAFYDLEYGPVSYDFLTFLLRAMKVRDQMMLDGLHVVIVPKEDGLGGFARHWGKHDEHAARWRLWHIVVASCPLAKATVTVAATRKQAQDIASWTGAVWWPEGKAHFIGPLVEAARKGEMIPKLQATEGARRYVGQWLPDDGQKIVTLTTRHQDTSPDRNSDPEAWELFEDWLMDKNYRVINVEDSNDALGRGQGYAELDPDLRLALYERADMNCIANNGPQDLLKFSAAPYLAFGQAPTVEWQAHFRKYFTLEPGEQLPWARADQRLIYKPDTFENMKAAFGEWENRSG